MVRRVWICVMVIGVAFMGASVAGAFTLPPSVIDDGTEGEVRLLWTEPVDPADVGKTCEVVVVATNNESIREGSDLIFESGGAIVVAKNVEREPSSRTVAGQLTLGATIVVSVQLGPEGVFSGGGLELQANCPPTVVPAPTILPPTGTAPSAPDVAPAPAAVVVSAQPSFTG